MEMGFTPWWTLPTAQLDDYRPLASLTHAIDYAVWPTQAWLMHLENLGGYAALVVVCAAFYRECLAPRWVAGLAAALYAFDHAHAGPVSWIANRNALMSTLFGVLSLMAHRRWRVRAPSGLARAAFAAAAVVLFALTLLSGEAGIAIAGYLAAFALCVDGGTLRSRLASLAPYGSVIVGWRILYRALGHGVVGAGFASDALLGPMRFAVRALQFLPILLVSDVVGVPGEVLGVWPRALPAAAIASYGVLALVVLSLWPVLRRDRGARFLGLGALLSAIPIASAPPSDRYVFMSAEVRTVTASAADRVAFTFPVALEGPSLVFMRWGAHGLEPFPLPHLEETTVVAAPPAAISGGIRWGAKDRAIEPD